MNRSFATLDLTSEERRSLASQGFISCESRGEGRVNFKLRFRHGGKQIVRCLGTDPAVADRVRLELERLQSATTARREMSRPHGEARQAMRRAKKNLAPLVHELGLRYHGYTLRRQRRARIARNAPSTTLTQDATSPISNAGATQTEAFHSPSGTKNSQA